MLKPLITECIDHIKHINQFNSDVPSILKFIELRLDIYEHELLKIFSEPEDGEGAYVGGIITYLIFEKPFTNKIEHSSDLFKFLETTDKIAFGIEKIKEAIIEKYDNNLEIDETALEYYEGSDQICLMCGGVYSVTELRKIRFTDIEFGSMHTGYACEPCSKKLSETDDQFQYLD